LSAILDRYDGIATSPGGGLIQIDEAFAPSVEICSKMDLTLLNHSSFGIIDQAIISVNSLKSRLFNFNCTLK
jgi:hypothetical protein